MCMFSANGRIYQYFDWSTVDCLLSHCVDVDVKLHSFFCVYGKGLCCIFALPLSFHVIKQKVLIIQAEITPVKCSKLKSYD